MRPLRVLLLSPVAALDPANGDVTYTEQLLANPPESVVYVSYPQALADGTLVERLRRRAGEAPGAALRREGSGLLRESLVNRARARGLMFREPFRHVEVRPGAFDVVHAHVYSVRLRSTTPVPLVVSNSTRLSELYRDGFELPQERVDVLRLRDERLAARTGVTHSAYGQAGAAKVVAFSEHLRQVLLAERPEDHERVVVVPPGVEPGPAPPEPVTDTPFHTGFVGDWRAKGGDLVLAAHRRLRSEDGTARLTVVGGAPRLSDRESARLGVRWLPRLPRHQLLDEVVPTWSAFAYPSRFDGLPLTLLEVMARGVPVVVSDYGALPEVVAGGRAGLVVPGEGVEQLTDALRLLREPGARRQFAAAARQRVLDAYDVRGVAASLGAVYASVGQAAGGRGRA